MRKIELLSPAKDFETGKAAIRCGADAVYLGANQFGARAMAGNSIEDIAKLVSYAHIYWAKVYVTINTLLFDDELPEAEKLAWQLYEIGVDALIIQDVGLLEMNLPPLALFASTQMHNHTPERVSFLEQAGFQRVILARELALDQIKEIQQRTNIELEAFIHGSLCVSYSGQCYMSYALGGRSGNRGQCAQPCRKLYSLIGKDGVPIVSDRYLLSLRDLKLDHSIADLLDAGVTSFKIEGRLKDKPYVMNVVGYYRKLIDEILEEKKWRASSSGKVQLNFEPDPAKTFNRGFSEYFLHGRNNDIAAIDSPKSIGEPIGKIISTDRGSFFLDEKATPLHPGDGICFLDQHKDLTGTDVVAVQENRITPKSMQKLIPGMQIYRNYNRVFIDRILKDSAERNILINMELFIGPDYLRLIGIDEDDNRAEVNLSIQLEPAEQTKNAFDTICRQLKKLGETEFESLGIKYLSDTVYFVPVSVLNHIRRELVEALRQTRRSNRPISAGSKISNHAKFPQELLTFEGNVLNKKAEDFYRQHHVNSIEPAAESGKISMLGRKLMTTKYCLRFQIGACLKQPNARKILEPLKLIDEKGNEFPLHFDCKECVMEIYHSKLEKYIAKGQD